MIISIFPSKDATLYEAAVSESVNTGIDEILEITKVISSSGTTQVSNTRALVAFDLNTVSKYFSDGVGSPNMKVGDDFEVGNDTRVSRSSGHEPDFFLNLFATEAKNIPINYHMSVAPVSESWDMGVGRHNNYPQTTEGVSWKYRDGENVGSRWNGPGVGKLRITGSWLDEPSASAQDTVFQSGLDFANGCYTGSIFYSGSAVTKSYQDADDVRVSVSKSIALWFSGDSANNGLLISRMPNEENDAKKYGSLMYFSNETKTIYKPRLDLCWYDSTFDVGALESLDVQNKDITVYLDNNYGTYETGSAPRFRVRGREKYPTKTYGTASAELAIKYLPSTTFYSLIDFKTKETIIPFDINYTKVSCDTDGNYFDFRMQGLYPERRYEFKVKVVSGSNVNYYDTNQPFKIVK